MEVTLIPEQTLTAIPDYGIEYNNVVSRTCYINAELVNVLCEPKNLGNSRKRLRGETRKTHLRFVTTANQIGKVATINCFLSLCPGTDVLHQDHWQQLSKETTANLNLTLVSATETDVELVRLQDKQLVYEQNQLRFTQTIDRFDFGTWNDVKKTILVKLSVSLCRKENPVDLGDGMKHTHTTCKRIFQTMEHADVKIEASNGVQFSCHKAFLSAQSPYFQRMFASGMQESVKLIDKSEDGVRAMLNFVYCGSLPKTSINCETALELLVAAEQYEFSGLGICIRDLFAAQSPNWFSTLVAVELWQFANKKARNENNESYACLELKAVQVLKNKPETEIKECPAVSKMLENPQAGILEFFLYLLKHLGRSCDVTTVSDTGRDSNEQNQYNQLLAVQNRRPAPMYIISSDSDLDDNDDVPNNNDDR